MQADDRFKLCVKRTPSGGQVSLPVHESGCQCKEGFSTASMAEVFGIGGGLNNMLGT